MRKLILVVVALFAAFTAHAQELSALPAASGVNGTDILPASQGATTRKVTATQIAAFVDAATGTVTGKTIDGDLNTLQDVGFSSLNPAMAPTWTGLHTWSAVNPRLRWYETDQAVDARLWDCGPETLLFTCRVRTDADGAGATWLSVTRSAAAVSQVTIGNASIGSWAIGGGQIVTSAQVIGPRFIPNGSATPSNGMYLPGTNRLGLSTNSTFALELTAAQKVDAKSGYLPDSAGLKHTRITTGSVAAAATALVTITWGTAFADANYTPACSVLEATNSSASMSVVHIETQSASALAVRVINNAAGALTGTLSCIAIHD